MLVSERVRDGTYDRATLRWALYGTVIRGVGLWESQSNRSRAKEKRQRNQVYHVKLILELEK